jgi:hypothetical protein
MLSVRLPQPLEDELKAFRNAQQMTKSAVIQLALEKHLRLAARAAGKTRTANPFTALRGVGNRQLSTDEIMCMTRGDDWNKP